MTTYAVTGASGQLGRLVAGELLSRVPAQQVVLLTRNPDALSPYAQRGAVVRRADFDDRTSLTSAFAGVDRLLLISIDRLGPERVDAQRRCVDVARSAGIAHVAYTSIPEPVPGNPAGVVPDHAQTEDLVRESGLAWTLLRNNVYADLQVDGLAHAGNTGMWLTNTGAGATAYVTRSDCAAVAAGVLVGEGHENQAYDVTGPQAWTAEDMAALAAERSERPVGVANVDDATYAAGLTEAGLPAAIAELLASFGAAGRDGYLSAVTDVVALIGGRPATSLRDLARPDVA